MKIISGSSNLQIAQQIAHHLQLPLVKTEITYFANGEKRVWIKESLKGQNVVLIQSFSHPVDEYLMELLLLADACERAGARNINAVIPWMGYSLQDKVFRDGEPIAAKVVANLISGAHIKRAFLLDLHNSSTPGFFDIPTQHLSASEVFSDYIRNHFDLNNVVVASPDFGGLKRARTFAERLGVALVNIDKHRDLDTGAVESKSVNGEVAGKDIIIFDDIVNTGGTIVSAAELLKKNGAKSVHFCATHGIFANNGIQRVTDSRVDSVIISNSITQPSHSDKIKVIDVSKIFADALYTWG
jgi:ribose-phosphate pyrophosphokinase